MSCLLGSQLQLGPQWTNTATTSAPVALAAATSVRTCSGSKLSGSMKLIPGLCSNPASTVKVKMDLPCQTVLARTMSLSCCRRGGGLIMQWTIGVHTRYTSLAWLVRALPGYSYSRILHSYSSLHKPVLNAKHSLLNTDLYSMLTGVPRLSFLPRHFEDA